MADHGSCIISIVGPTIGGGYLLNGPRTVNFPYADIGSGFRDSSAPEYAAVSPFMRAGKIMTYVGRSQRTVSVLIRIMTKSGGQDVYDQALWLAALKDSYLDENVGVMRAPPVVSVYLGAISITAVVVGCEIVWKGPWYGAISQGDTGEYIDGKGAMPGQADVMMTFSEVTTGSV